MHDDKIWAMDLFEKITQHEDGEFSSKIEILTGGGDSTLKFWEEYTAEQELELKQAELERLA